MARFVIHPDGAEDYAEGQQIVSLVRAGHRDQADHLAMFAALLGRQLTVERILEIERRDEVFAEESMHQLLEELGIEIPYDALY